LNFINEENIEEKQRERELLDFADIKEGVSKVLERLFAV
jgi:hypothetical protein